MKRLITLLAAVCLFTIGMNAQDRPHYEGTTEVGFISYFSPYDGPYSIPGFDFHYVPGCRINENIFVGGGFGISPSMLVFSVPIYANFKYYFTGRKEHRKLYPFINTSLGCNLAIDGDAYPGYYLDVSAGCNYELTSKVAAYLKLGLQSFSVYEDALLGPSFHVGLTF